MSSTLHGLDIEALYTYSEKYSTPQSELLTALEAETHAHHRQPHMLSGHLQGRFLSLIAKLVKPQCIVEFGTYTGYSALCLAEGLAPDGVLHTLELDETKEPICNKYFSQSAFKNQIQLHIGVALENLKKITEPVQLVFIDADKTNYCNYYNTIFDQVVSGGIIIADNVLFHGHVLQDDKGKNGTAVHEYNTMIQNDTRVETLIIPLRDGLSIVQKK